LLKARHMCFDLQRNIFPISSSIIRSKPAKFWNFIPEVVKPYFVKKIAIVGSESTGKSILTERLAHHYKTEFVAEVARDIICHTKECTYEDLNKIAVEQSKAILAKQNFANKFLFIDTEINTTKSYSKFLFNLELEAEEWIEKTNKCDMYIYLQPDCPHIQDGTRLNNQERLYLDLAHKQQFKKSKVEYISISGNWEERFTRSCKVIDEVFLS
jgi:HTH-type transcriptional repressor of NAD biosynthesis genes